MSNEPTSVTVRVGMTEGTTPFTVTDAVRFEVTEGALFVERKAGKMDAVFAAGHWTSMTEVTK